MFLPAGQFVWCELMTTDIDAATAFYTEAIGWHAQDAGAAHVRYAILHAGPTPMGGLVEMPQSVLEAGARPCWIGYIGVDDVDAMAARITAAGGSVHRAPDNIPGVGRFAVVADPQGGTFTLFKPLPGGPPPSAAGHVPGRVGWHELHAADWEAAFAFYEALFGWTKTDAIDIGTMGTYQTFATGGVSGDGMVGGMMNRTGPDQPSGWLYYFNVDDIAAATGRVTRAGGTVRRGPHQVPGDIWIAQCTDPHGVTFAMTSMSNAG